MNQLRQLRLLAKFESLPSDKEKKEIETELKSFILEIDPNAHLEIKTGDGSWWISIIFWIGEHFAGWLLDKGLDKGSDRIGKRKSIQSSSSLPESNPSGLSSSSELSGIDLVQSDQNSEKPWISPASSLMNDMLNLVDRVDKTGGKTKITLGAFSQEKGYGHVASIVKDNNNNNIDFSIIQTDSEDDFNYRTNP